MKRTLWETLAVLIAVLAIFGVWKWSEAAAHQAAEEQAQQHTLETERLKQEAAAWAKRLAENQAEAVFTAFAAGIQPAVLAGSTNSLLVSKQQLLHLPNLAFVHLLKPNGEVIFSSDEKLTMAGRVGERGKWALSAPQLMRRPGEREGTLELAAPIEGVTETEAVLWMGYNTSGLEESTGADAKGAGSKGAMESEATTSGQPEAAAAAPGSAG